MICVPLLHALEMSSDSGSLPTVRFANQCVKASKSTALVFRNHGACSGNIKYVMRVLSIRGSGRKPIKLCPPAQFVGARSPCRKATGTHSELTDDSSGTGIIEHGGYTTASPKGHQIIEPFHLISRALTKQPCVDA
jgi:hypothetical protein